MVNANLGGASPGRCRAPEAISARGALEGAAANAEAGGAVPNGWLWPLHAKFGQGLEPAAGLPPLVSSRDGGILSASRQQGSVPERVAWKGRLSGERPKLHGGHRNGTPHPGWVMDEEP